MLIEAKNLSKTYMSGEVETRAVCDVSFTIDKKEFVAIMGPSGSGKSTLMQMLGLLDRPTGGKYFLDGRDTNEFSDDELAELRNKRIGFVFQTFNLLPRTTVYENVELPLLYDHAASNKRNREEIMEALESVGMEHRVNYFSNQLSGGEKQRVAIARALVTDPEIIFADEPTGNLDSKSGIQIMKILQELNEKGKTIILVTHENYTAKHAKRILSIIDGKIVSDKPVEGRMKAGDKEYMLK
ncbi:MAG: ABC transporter ATP-binding protein [Candidatus Moranbacteria bacterium]|jgi:putative ABC transport system ATP-binding protein|nr:ABC transporter ATP-binding protein [Candidatus Moranbacteria bacterium]MDD5652229.1 ABC transporter ATP-binding protein [Candidatus Moranbacteria bacterium]MDX9855321.1 ABC transporter ATP-binding protein [Candidatus Moranbacteria bacterium]